MKSLLILDFVDNILDKHNYSSCKSNITFLYYLICHIYPKNMYISVGTVRSIGPQNSELIQNCWARGPFEDMYPSEEVKSRHKAVTEGDGGQPRKSKVLYPSENTILLGSMRPRTIGMWSYCNQISELGHRKRQNNRPRMKEIRQTNIYDYSCLRINDLSTNFLAALMWR